MFVQMVIKEAKFSDYQKLLQTFDSPSKTAVCMDFYRAEIADLKNIDAATLTHLINESPNKLRNRISIITMLALLTYSITKAAPQLLPQLLVELSNVLNKFPNALKAMMDFLNLSMFNGQNSSKQHSCCSVEDFRSQLRKLLAAIAPTQPLTNPICSTRSADMRLFTSPSPYAARRSSAASSSAPLCADSAGTPLINPSDPENACDADSITRFKKNLDAKKGEQVVLLVDDAWRGIARGATSSQTELLEYLLNKTIDVDNGEHKLWGQLVSNNSTFISTFCGVLSTLEPNLLAKLLIGSEPHLAAPFVRLMDLNIDGKTKSLIIQRLATANNLNFREQLRTVAKTVGPMLDDGVKAAIAETLQVTFPESKSARCCCCGWF